MAANSPPTRPTAILFLFFELMTQKVCLLIFVMLFALCAADSSWKSKFNDWKLRKSVGMREEISFGKLKLQTGFDVDSDSKIRGIYLSKGIYDQFMKELSTLSIKNCSKTASLTVTCEFGGSLNSLPDLILTRDNQTLSIPARLWLLKPQEAAKESRIFTLNLQPIDSSSKVILGQDIMNQDISLAPSVSPPFSLTHLTPTTIVVLVSAILGIVLLIACCYRCQSSYNKQNGTYHQRFIEEQN